MQAAKIPNFFEFQKTFVRFAFFLTKFAANCANLINANSPRRFSRCGPADSVGVNYFAALKLMSSPLTEWVSAPTEMKSTPASP